MDATARGWTHPLNADKPCSAKGFRKAHPQRLQDPVVDLGGFGAGVDVDYTLDAGREATVAGCDTRVEGRILSLHSVWQLPGRALPVRAFRGIQIEKQGRLRADASGGHRVARQYLIQRNPATLALIGERGEFEPICDDNASGTYTRHDDLLHERGTRSQHQEELTHRRDLHVSVGEDGAADALTEPGGAWLARHHHVDPPLPQTVGEPRDLSRLPRALDPLEGEEQPRPELVSRAAHSERTLVRRVVVTGRAE